MNDKEILQKLRLETMPKEVQEQTLIQIHQVVELRLMGVIDDLMTDEQRTAFEALSKENTKSVQRWLSEQFTDLEKLEVSVLEDYITEVTQKTNTIVEGE